MLNRKFHRILIVLGIILLILDFSFTYLDKSYSILGAVGLESIEDYVSVFFVCFVFFCCIIPYCYRKCSSQCYEILYNGKYIEAQKLIEKNYYRNKTLFYKHYLFLLFSIGEQKRIEEFCKENAVRKKKVLICNKYTTLLSYLTDTPIACDLERLINVSKAKGKKNDYLTFLLEAISALRSENYHLAKTIVESIPRLFHYPIFGLIINKIVFESNMKLNLNYDNALQNAEVIADNEFLRNCFKILLERCNITQGVGVK